MHFSQSALVLTLIPSTLAYSCLSSIALAWPAGGIRPSNSVSPPGSNAGGSSSCSSKCGNDLACVKACLAVIAQGECNAVGGSACPEGEDNGNLIDNGTNNSDDPSDGLIKRATLTCTTSEVCYKYTDDSLLCIDIATGTFTSSFYISHDQCWLVMETQRMLEIGSSKLTVFFSPQATTTMPMAETETRAAEFTPAQTVKSPLTLATQRLRRPQARRERERLETR